MTAYSNTDGYILSQHEVDILYKILPNDIKELIDLGLIDERSVFEKAYRLSEVV